MLAALANAQQPTGPAATRGACSPATTGNNNSFTISCGIGKEQGEKLIAILNKILSNQIDPSAVMSKLDDIQKGVEDIKQNTARRRLSAQEKQRLTEALSPMAGHTINITCTMGDTEGKDFAMDFVEVFRAAHWLGVENGGVSQAIWSADPVGVQIEVSEDDVAANTVPADAQAIFAAIKSATGAVLPGTKGKSPSGQVQLIVGRKP